MTEFKIKKRWNLAKI